MDFELKVFDFDMYDYNLDNFGLIDHNSSMIS